MDSPLINSQFPGEEILKNHSVIRCEDASFYFFHHMFEVKYDPNPGWGMSPIQTIDLLDFSGNKMFSTWYVHAVVPFESYFMKYYICPLWRGCRCIAFPVEHQRRLK